MKSFEEIQKELGIKPIKACDVKPVPKAKYVCSPQQQAIKRVG